MWNSGMFVWKTSVILEEFASFMPQILRLAEAAAKFGFSKDAISTFYENCPKESIDFGIMEHSRRVFAVVGDFLWDDIGSWESISRVHPRDKLNSTV
jgi:mannose-1-phosphate guanylyltransferase